ncbi:MAG TPA: MDR family MFS transporter [Candidatus Limnocylindrales bacterium]|nr:MDR family MFS transporter [Candidatus Limnocylindrales bacterium]
MIEGAPVTATGPELTHPAIEVDPRTRFEILGAVLLGLFLTALDQTIVGPVLPQIVTTLHGSDLYVWVVTAYLVTSTVTIPIYGKLSDLYGRKPLLLAGISFFLVGSALSGLSQEMWQLILFRALQGLGAGSLFPISLAIIGDLFTPAERGKYQGVFGAVFGIAFIVGPGLGGFLTDNISWHWVFFVNLPIGLVALFVIARLLPGLKRQAGPVDIDMAGVVTMGLALVPILIGLTNAEQGDWSDPSVWGFLVFGAVFLVLFVFAERRAKDPMVPLELFRNRTFTVSVVATFLASFGFFAAIIFLPLWFQVVQGASATASGYDLLPFLIGLMGTSILAGFLVSKTGRYKTLIVVGMVMLVIGMALFTNLRADTPTPVLWAWMFLAGVGIGPTMAIFTLIVQNAVPFKFLGTATSDLTLFRQIGGTVGLTVGFTLFQNFLSLDLLKSEWAKAGIPQQVLSQIPAGAIDLSNATNVGATSNPVAALASQVPEQFRPLIEPLVPKFIQGFDQAFSIAIAQSMWLGVGAAILALLTTFLIRELPLSSTLGVTHGDTVADTTRLERASATD